MLLCDMRPLPDGRLAVESILWISFLALKQKHPILSYQEASSDDLHKIGAPFSLIASHEVSEGLNAFKH
jgi:hypothetical protein